MNLSMYLPITMHSKRAEVSCSFAYNSFPDLNIPVDSDIFLMFTSNLASNDIRTPMPLTHCLFLISVLAGMTYVGVHPLFLYYISSVQIYHCYNVYCFDLLSCANAIIVFLGYKSHVWYVSLARAWYHLPKILTLLT